MGSTRERLLDVAFELFAEEGFGGTTITEVERRAGLTPGTGSFYRHFPSKRALLRAAVDREVARCMAEIEEERAVTPVHDDPARERVHQLELMLRDIRRFDRLQRLMLGESDWVPEVRGTIASTLLRSGGIVSWKDNPSAMVRIAALGGYHLLSKLEGPLHGVAEDEFIAALAELTGD